MNNPYGEYITTNRSNRDISIQFDDRYIALNKAISEQSKNQLDRVMYEDLIRKQTDVRVKPDDLSVDIALNERNYISDNQNKIYFKKPHQRPPQDTLIIMSRLLNKILEKPENILSDITKSDDAIYCSGIFLLLSGTSLYLLANIFS